MPPPWKPLRLKSERISLPPLLIKYQFGLSDYSIYITDLTYIWMESLDRRRIIRRALDMDTSIDPSEGPDQLQLLLRNIQSSLDGQAGTKLSISREGGQKNFLLQVSAPLPVPLRPLDWPVHLLPASQEILTAEFVIPCLTQQVIAKTEISSLLLNVKDKDHIINRLMGKLQSAGIDVSTVFPGLISSKSRKNLATRDAAGDSVKGLREFNEQEWRKSLSISAGALGSLDTLIREAFSSNPTALPNDTQTSQDKAWWNHLEIGEKSRVVVDLGSSSLKSGLHYPGEMPSDHDSRRKSIPSHESLPVPDPHYTGENNRTLPQLARRLSSTPTDDDVTSDESDGTVESESSNLVSEKRGSVNPQISHNNRRDIQPTLSAVVEPGMTKGSHHPVPVYNHEDKKLVADAEDLSIQGTHRVIKDGPGEDIWTSKGLVITSTSSDPATPSKFKSKLGRIGGKHNRVERTSDADPRTMPSLLSNSQGDADMTAVGENPAVANWKPISSGGTEALPTDYPNPPRETSEERADKKRELLKRELEEKSKISTKKKRRF